MRRHSSASLWGFFFSCRERGKSRGQGYSRELLQSGKGSSSMAEEARTYTHIQWHWHRDPSKHRAQSDCSICPVFCPLLMECHGTAFCPAVVNGMMSLPVWTLCCTFCKLSPSPLQETAGSGYYFPQLLLLFKKISDVISSNEEIHREPIGNRIMSQYDMMTSLDFQ